MSRLRRFVRIYIVFSVFEVLIVGITACSEANFSSNDNPSLQQQCVETGAAGECSVVCNGDQCERIYDYSRQVENTPSDILFVVDNSGSMTAEQAAMAGKFPNFMSSVAGLDYRIGVTTTDISGNDNLPDEVNGYGALQDGRLIPLEPGRLFLDGSLSEAQEQSLFINTVTRQESLVCRDNNHQGAFCPSGDERGILAAYKSLQRNEGQFIRNNGKLDIIILSDEDERSVGGDDKPLLDEETPIGFMDRVKSMYPSKSLKVHSIVIQPFDWGCYGQQRGAGTPPGNFGNVYAELTTRTEGVPGSICASDYGALLQGIGEKVAELREALPCRPLNDDIKVSFNPQPATPIEPVTDFDRLEVSFSQPVPFGTQVRFEYRCSSEQP